MYTDDYMGKHTESTTIALYNHVEKNHTIFNFY